MLYRVETGPRAGLDDTQGRKTAQHLRKALNISVSGVRQIKVFTVDGLDAAQVARHRLGMLGLVEGGLVKAHGKGLDRAAGLRLHQRHHGGRIDPARQKRAQRHIGHHLLANCVFQQRLQRVHRLRGGAGKGLRRAAPGHLGQRPIRLQHRLGRGLRHGQQAAGLQLADAFVYGTGAAHVVVPHKQAQRIAVDRRTKRRVRAQRLQFGTKQKHL